LGSLTNFVKQFCFREKSTKTRIETPEFVLLPRCCILVLEKNPPKQGLKLFFKKNIGRANPVLEKNPPKQGLKLFNNIRTPGYPALCFREKSTKTRIETSNPTRVVVNWIVLEKNPPKQGLKLLHTGNFEMHIGVLEKNPPKQGLKPPLMNSKRSSKSTF